MTPSKVTLTLEIEYAGLTRVIKGSGEHEDPTAAMDIAFAQLMQVFAELDRVPEDS